ENQITEGFNQGLQLPDGWTTNSISTTQNPAYCGAAPPALQLRSSGDYLQTETYNTGVKRLSLVVKSVSSWGSIMYVKAWNGSSFTGIDTISINLTLAETLTYDFTENDNYTAFRFEYAYFSGYAALDDITVYFDKTINNVVTDKWVEGLTDTIKNLSAETDFYYKVRASDKTLKPDGSLLYENITDFSNIIHVKTDIFTEIPVIRQDEFTGKISVYSIAGQLLYQADAQKFDINALQKEQVLILKAGEKVVKIVR
ncbi:MAG: hypothetical protein LBN23_08945, partial [Paludibacter sp.]|nr:hypothetical protein [Paludibacter sp.]